MSGIATDRTAPSDHAGSPDSPTSGFTDPDRRFLRWLLIVFLVGCTIQWFRLVTTRPVPPELIRGEHFQKYFSVDVNTAGWIEWMQLEGIGPSLAHRIVAERDLNGPFQTIDDILRVPGIGPATLDRIRSRLTISYANKKSEDDGERFSPIERSEQRSRQSSDAFEPPAIRKAPR
jgi:competence protein ComEA